MTNEEEIELLRQFESECLDLLDSVRVEPGSIAYGLLRALDKVQDARRVDEEMGGDAE